MARSVGTIVVFVAVLLSAGCTTDNDFLRPGDPTIADDLMPVDTFRALNDPHLFGTVTFTWYDPQPNPYGTLVVSYYLAMNPSGGPVTTENWGKAEVIGVYPRVWHRSYRHTFDDETVIPRGDKVTYAVRPRYEYGIWGPIGDTITLTPSRAQAHGGRVVDDAGAPLEGVVVRLKGYEEFDDPRGFTAEAVTDADGNFSPLGPISEYADFILETHSNDRPSAPGIEDAWFDYRTPTVDYGTDIVDAPIVLIPRYGFDPAADGSSEWSTIELLQVLSRTNETHMGDVVNCTYRHWLSYPVPVFIPPGLSADGAVDLQAEVRRGMNYWNEVLGKVVFVETHDPEAEGLTCLYDAEELGSLFSGKMEFVPQAPGEDWGLAIPRVARLILHPVLLRTPVFAQETIRHELAHALGCYGHTFDTYGMMYISGGDQEALDYEIRLIKTLIALPNGTVMTGYEEAYPARENF